MIYSGMQPAIGDGDGVENGPAAFHGEDLCINPCNPQLITPTKSHGRSAIKRDNYIHASDDWVV